MGLFDFLQGVFALFIKNFPAFILKLFRKIPVEIKEELSVINNAVNAIKEFVDGPVADAIVAAIPGDRDDKFREWFSHILWIALEALDINQSGIVKLPVDDLARSLKLTSLNAYLNAKTTGAEPTQALITSSVFYKGSTLS